MFSIITFRSFIASIILVITISISAVFPSEGGLVQEKSSFVADQQLGELLNKTDLISDADISSTNTDIDSYNIYDAISNENLKSLSSVDDNGGGLVESINDIELNGFKAFIQSSLESQLNPNKNSKQRLVLQLLTEYYNKNKLPESSVLDEVTWQDLNILCGPKSDTRMHLASRITEGRTVTSVGTATIFRMLVQPTADVEKLLNQQKVTKELIKNEKLFNDLDSLLKELVVPENIVLSFWDSEDIFALILEQERRKIPFDDKVDFLKKISDKINKSPAFLETFLRAEVLFGHVGNLLAFYGAIALPVYALTGRNILSKLPAKDLNVVTPYTLLGIGCFAAGKIVAENVYNRIKSGAAFYNYAKQSYEATRNFGENKALFRCLHKKVSYLAKYLQNLKEMSNFVNQHPVLTSNLPAVKIFTQSLENLKNKSSDFGHLLYLLETKTFKSGNTRLSYFSRVMVAHKLMREQKENFVEAMLAVGELDAQLTIAKLYKEFENKRVKFCFPDYLTPADYKTPAIRADDFWNPFLDSEKAIPNSIEIGSIFNTPQNVIITGPNAGGKSTITKALVFSIILGQSLGIAPAESFVFTPMSTIMTYLNITDDIAAGNSHFKAGVIRARELLLACENLSIANNHLGLFAVDEVFNGTTFKEGQAAAFTLIDELGQNPACICVTNTHFPLITTLEEKTNNFLNYKVSVIDKPGEKIKNTYTLERGISHQNVALKILNEEGFDDGFIRKAQALIV